MPKKKDELTQCNYRLPDETVKDIAALQAAISAEAGYPVSQAVVIRLAIRDYAAKKLRKTSK